MTKEKIIICGAGGHGKVIADIVEKSGGNIAGFVDTDKALWGTSFCNYPVFGGDDELFRLAEKEEIRVIIGIGDNNIRRKIKEKFETRGIKFATAVHPSAVLGRGVVIETGSVVMAGAIINPDTFIGEHCIINTAVSVDHDCRIGDFVHISPGAHLGGTVTVGDSTWIGLGASIINNINISGNVIIGSGSVVIRDVESNIVVAGNPARFLRKNNSTI